MIDELTSHQKDLQIQAEQQKQDQKILLSNVVNATEKIIEIAIVLAVSYEGVKLESKAIHAENGSSIYQSKDFSYQTYRTINYDYGCEFGRKRHG